MTLTSKSADQDLVILLDEVQATVIGDKSGDLLAVLDQLDTNALPTNMLGELVSEKSLVNQNLGNTILMPT